MTACILYVCISMAKCMLTQHNARINLPCFLLTMRFLEHYIIIFAAVRVGGVRQLGRPVYKVHALPQ